MQSHNFQCFNVISQKKKKGFFLWTDSYVNRNFSVFVQCWLHRQMAGDSCYLSRNMKDLFSSKTWAWVCVLCALWVPGMVEVCWCMCACWARGSSVQSQQWLGVLAFSLVFMFQRASFHHRLGPESKKICMLAKAAAEALTFLESLCFILWFLLLSIFILMAF